MISPQAEQSDHEYNIFRRLQQSSASDDHAAVYDNRLSSGEMGEQQGGRHYYEGDSGNYNVQHQQEGDYDDDNYPRISRRAEYVPSSKVYTVTERAKSC